MDAYLGFVVEVVKRPPGQPGFQPVAKKFGQLSGHSVGRFAGRLVRDWERRLDVSESMIHIAMSSVLLKRFSMDE